MFILQLNDMRQPMEQLSPVARADTAEELFALMDREKCDQYDDQNGGKVYRKLFKRDGPLEWFNPPKGEVHDKDQPYIMRVGTLDEWVEMVRKDYEAQVMSIPHVDKLGLPAVIQL